MERLKLVSTSRRRPTVEPELDPRCLRCGHLVADRPRGCKAGHCPNCGHPYPLGDCSD